MRLAGGRLRPGQTVRVHLALRPSPQTKAHWNNETGGLTVWLDLPDGWLADRSRLSAHNAPEPLSRETRRIERREPVDRPAR